LHDDPNVRAWWWIGVVWGCAGAPSVTAPDDAMVRVDASDVVTVPLRVELGEGLTRYRALPAEGAEIELVFGPQGGWHFDLAARVHGGDPEGMRLRYAVTNAAGMEVQFPGVVQLNARRVVPEGEGFVRVGDRAVLDVRDGNALVGQTLTLSVRAEGARGATADDRRAVTVVDRVR
jgi:hypothetical protein